MDDDEFYNYGTPWGFGQIVPLSETPCKPNKKRMKFIGFYENKETCQEKSVPNVKSGKKMLNTVKRTRQVENDPSSLVVNRAANKIQKTGF